MKNNIAKLTSAFPMIKVVTQIMIRRNNEYALSFYRNKSYEEQILEAVI